MAYQPTAVPFAKAKEVARQLDLPTDVAEDLMGAAGIDVVVVADDSFSMDGARWAEMIERLKQLCGILAFPHPDNAFRLMFLNSAPPGESGPMTTVRGPADIDALDGTRNPRGWARPCGATPLGRALESVFALFGSDRRGIVVVMTDGAPSDLTFGQLQQLVARRSPLIAVNFCMCTEDSSMVAQYNDGLDRIDSVDIHDDHAAERAEARAIGRDLPLNLYLVKCLLGALMPKYDKMDEIATPVGPTHRRATVTAGPLAEPPPPLPGLCGQLPAPPPVPRRRQKENTGCCRVS